MRDEDDYRSYYSPSQRGRHQARDSTEAHLLDEADYWLQLLRNAERSCRWNDMSKAGDMYDRACRKLDDYRRRYYEPPVSYDYNYTPKVKPAPVAPKKVEVKVEEPKPVNEMELRFAGLDL